MNDWPPNHATNDDAARGAARRSWLSRLGSFVLLQFLALAVFVGFPALVTAIAPVSWVSLERRDGQVSATAKTCLLFCVPYKIAHVAEVSQIGDRVVTGTVTRERRPGRDRETKSEDEGFLVIHGHDRTAEVQVSPHDLKSVTEQVEGFLNDPQASELKLFVVANWKFSILAGGLISLLTVLYVATLAFGIALKVIHVFQWVAGVPSERRLFAKQGKADSGGRG